MQRFQIAFSPAFVSDPSTAPRHSPRTALGMTQCGGCSMIFGLYWRDSPSQALTCQLPQRGSQEVCAAEQLPREEHRVFEELKMISEAENE